MHTFFSWSHMNTKYSRFFFSNPSLIYGLDVIKLSHCVAGDWCFQLASGRCREIDFTICEFLQLNNGFCVCIVLNESTQRLSICRRFEISARAAQRFPIELWNYTLKSLNIGFRSFYFDFNKYGLCLSCNGAPLFFFFFLFSLHNYYT